MNFILYLFLFLICFSSAIIAQPSKNKKWKLKYEDKFKGKKLDTTKWSFGFGWGLNSEAFEEKTRKENLTLKSGKLIIKAEEVDGVYYSAAVNTKNKMIGRYGYWEIKAKIPKLVSGSDVGFWQKLNSDIWPPELDIFEYMGTAGTQAMNIHWPDSANKRKEKQEFYNGGDMTKGYHIYGLEYDPNYIKWWTDGKVVREIKPSEFPDFFKAWDNDQIYTILNIHLSNRYEVFGKVDATNLPMYLYVDYFRFYEKKD